MNTRPNIASTSRRRTQTHPHPHHQAHQLLSYTTSPPPLASSSRPLTPTRLPSHSSTSRNHSTQPGGMAEPATPTPRKPRRRNGARTKRADQRNEHAMDAGAGIPQHDQEQDGGEQSPSSEDELMDLLGVASPIPASGDAQVPRAEETQFSKGILAISKDDISASLRQGKGKGRGRGRKDNDLRLAADSELGTRGALNGEGDGVSKGNSGAVKQRREAPAYEIRGSHTAKGEGVDSQTGQTTPKRKGRRAAQFTDDVDHSSSQPGFSNGAKPNVAMTRRSDQSDIAQPIPVSAKMSASHSFDTSSLSQSLPTSHSELLGSRLESKGKNKGKRDVGKQQNGGATNDESLVWDMPEGAAGSQELTWQQKLQSSTSTSSPTPDTSKRGAKFTTSDSSNRKKSANQRAPPSAMPHIASHPSPLNPNPNANNKRPQHSRRLSLDDRITHDNKQGQNLFSFSPSAFDISQPYHTGFNVHRAPQTPSRPLAFGVPAVSDNLPLIQGDFPRLAGQGQGPRVASAPAPAGIGLGGNPGPMGIKYAGPTFHNSPHAASLPKPDLEDF